jgi:hypothetical protein
VYVSTAAPVAKARLSTRVNGSGCSVFIAAIVEGARGHPPQWSGQEAVPVTELPDFVTVYVSCVPLQKWNVSVTARPSVTSAKNSGFSVMVFAL